MLKIKLPGKKSMESNDVAKTKQSSSGEEIGNMKKKSSAANVRNTGRISSIRVLYEYKPEPEDTERKKSTEEIILYDRNSRSEGDVDTNTQGDTKQGNEGCNVLPRKSLSKTVSIAKSQGDATLEAIVATPSSSDATPSTSDAIPPTSDATPSSNDATNKMKTNEVHLKTKDIAKAKKIFKAAKNNKITHAMMTRSKLKKILETEYGVSASDYLSVESPEKPFVIHDLRKPAQRKRPGSPIKRQVKKTKK